MPSLYMTKNRIAVEASDVWAPMATLGHGVLSVSLSPHHTPSFHQKTKWSALMQGLVTLDTLTLIPLRT
jgi:hypothetical protein